jgi:hypothetical protein
MKKKPAFFALKRRNAGFIHLWGKRDKQLYRPFLLEALFVGEWENSDRNPPSS